MKNFIFIKTTGLAILLCTLISGCVTTEEFYGASELNRADDDMQLLLVKAEQSPSSLLADEIEGLAQYSASKAETLNQAGHPHLAIGFYRVATIGFWKDKIDSTENNAAFFKSVNSAQSICTEMGDKAPDRDCFFLAYAPLFAAVDETLKESSLIEFSVNESDASAIQAVRDFTIELAGEKAPNISASNGSLTNLIALAVQQQGFLSDHPSMASYICSNIKNVTSRYIAIAARLANNANTNKDTIESENPLYSNYLNGEYADSVNTIDKQVSQLINSRVVACS